MAFCVHREHEEEVIAEGLTVPQAKSDRQSSSSEPPSWYQTPQALSFQQEWDQQQEWE